MKNLRQRHHLSRQYSDKVYRFHNTFNAGRQLHKPDRIAETIDDLRLIAAKELDGYAITLLTFGYAPDDPERHGQPVGKLQRLTEGDQELTLALLLDQRPEIPPDQQIHHYCVVPMNNYQTYEKSAQIFRCYKFVM